ncbi:MAG: PQQ-binding-like beta-propeller repeat protein, partial [Terriglobales bacterium]
AQTGALSWKYNTSDDGPTAAVVEGGYCAFNTESCTVFVLDAKSGKLVWKEWLGDPLMSQPAIWGGKLYIAYPGGASQGNKKASPPGHRMLCADLKTGKHIWDKPITSDVISAPIVSSGKLYFSCQDGTSFCLDGTTGKEIFKKADASTSAPTIAGDKILGTQKFAVGKDEFESISVKDYRGATLAKHNARKVAFLAPPSPAATLSSEATSIVGINTAGTVALDSSVGFSTAPGSANLSKAKSNIGVTTVVGGWAYQGSRVAYSPSKSMMVNAQGNKLSGLAYAPSLQSATNGTIGSGWTAEAKGGKINENAQVFAPPSLGKDNMYVVSGQGHVLSVDQKSGKLKFAYATNEPMTFQPALAEGNIYVGTSNGMLLCFKTGDADATDWSGWGGNAQHNKEK